MAQWTVEGMKVYGRQADILSHATLKGQAVFHQTNRGYPAAENVKAGVVFGQLNQLTGELEVSGNEVSVVF